MNLIDAILALGNDYDPDTEHGQAADLWGTGIHYFVYKKRGKDYGMPYVRFEIDSQRKRLTHDTIATFQVLDDEGDNNPGRVSRILDAIGNLFENKRLEVDAFCFGSMNETSRREEGREGIWIPEMEFTIGMTANLTGG